MNFFFVGNFSLGEKNLQKLSFHHWIKCDKLKCSMNRTELLSDPWFSPWIAYRCFILASSFQWSGSGGNIVHLTFNPITSSLRTQEV